MKKFLIGLTVLSLFSCGDFFQEPCFRELKFEIPITFANINDTIPIGKGISISSDLNYLLEDLNSNEELNTKDILIDLSLTIFKINEENHEYVPEEIEILEKEGEIEIFSYSSELVETGIGYSYNIFYADNLDYRHFEFEIKFAEAGLYCMIFNSFYLKYDPMIIPNCNENLRRNDIRLNNGDIVENNYHLILNSSESVEIKALEDEEVFKHYGCYSFYVN